MKKKSKRDNNSTKKVAIELPIVDGEPIMPIDALVKLVLGWVKEVASLPEQNENESYSDLRDWFKYGYMLSQAYEETVKLLAVEDEEERKRRWEEHKAKTDKESDIFAKRAMADVRKFF